MGLPYSFDARRAYLHTEQLCYPRRIGTVPERRAARYIRREFAALGLPSRRERFVVSHVPAEVLGRLAFAAAALLALAGAWLTPARPALAAGCWGMAALLVNAPWRLGLAWLPRWPLCTSSANLLAALPAPPADAPARVVFMAHYDTKSQFLPTGIRVALVTGATLLCAALAVLGLVAALGLGEPLDAAGPWRLSLAAVGMLVGLILNVTGNRSPGALDNGSAVGTLLELARTWRPRPEAPADVLWVASGAEETGLDGARHFLASRDADWWREKPTLLINLESVGAGAHVYLAGEPAALRLARDLAGELGVPHRRLRVLGAGMDHEPFAARGLPALSILGDVVSTSFALHSTRDNMRLIDPAALERAGRLAAHLAWTWAALHQGPVPVVEQPAAARPLAAPVTV